MGRRGPKSWASTEQTEFLLSRLSQFIECRQTKVYKPFLTNTWNTFEAQWPECNCAYNNIPVEGDLTTVEIKALTKVKSKRKLMIQTWYRWQTNAACLARSGRLKGALDLSKTLSGGDEVLGRAPQEVEVYSHIFYNERVKGEADAAIKAEGINTRGKKLARQKDLTCVKYATEDDDIRAEVQEKHQEALTNWKEKRELARASFVQEVEQEEKIKAFNELGAHLNHIFRHLSYKTGGFKFTCIAGGRNPTTGDIVVLDYHLGETDVGSEFSVQYTGFGEVQTAYTDFVKLALAHDDNMQALADAGNADEVVNNNSDGEPNKSDEIFGEGSQVDKEKAEEGQVMDNTGMELNGLYQFDLMDDYTSTIPVNSPTGTGITGIAAVPNNNDTPLDLDQFDLSSLDMTDVDTFFTSLPYDPFQVAASVVPQEDSAGPRRTTRHHVPSTHEHVLNAIGSSGARVCPPVSVDKENNKQKGKSTGTEEQSRKKQKRT
ncbi:uncharacterized protein EDB91DRAFT_1256903 [Suillus paluster]|uniref:uncharacterized protein n=1 Tax=Suillus paluster TaxID=48578 RepID=UPI001B87AF0A|nr:uncharacterized protein EDB91DRAFT_1256903 [Suillus paluster]KAG1720606.1 hypothetical protein EDB91DRAFT_1256903 [Suillus paluster]